jgi:hypothetical protein
VPPPQQQPAGGGDIRSASAQTGQSQMGTR